MLDAFVIVLREGFEAFLIVSIVLAYLRKTGQTRLTPVVYAAIAASVAASAGLAWWINRQTDGVNQAYWEGVLGLVAIVLVVSLIIHMRRIAPKMKQMVHERLDAVTASRSTLLSSVGVFIFTLLMITREGMETALLLLQVQGQLLVGALLGIAGAMALAWAWARYGHLVNMKRFFQVTSLYLTLFLLQVAIYTFHEFAEAGVLPNSEALHTATEMISPDGAYGKWFSLAIIVVCAGWLALTYLRDRGRRAVPPELATGD